jgi:pilus assembly protein CpaB
MKKNMVPLFGIAFVVAIVCTGVFYGLFAGRLRSKPVELAGQPIVVAARDLDRGTVLKAGDVQVSQVRGALAGSYAKVDAVVGATLLEPVQQNEPLLQSRVASRDPKAGGASGGIASGMRAVSIRVAESSGLMGMLHEGSRVDLQAVSERSGASELRTVLQNVEVLRVSPQLEPVGNNRPPVPVATVLVPAEYADLIAVADSGARIRIALRNPLDEATPSRRSLGLAAVFSGTQQARTAETGAKTDAKADAKTPQGRAAAADVVQLHVEVLGATPEAVNELESKLAPSKDEGSLGVAAFRSGADADEVVRKLEQKHELELVSSSNLTASVGQPASVRAAAPPYHLRVRFAPSADSLGKVGLLVEPEFSLRRGAGVQTLRYDARMPQDVTFLVRGLLKDQSDSSILTRLYPGHSWSGRQLVIFVTARSRGHVPASAVAQREQ